jgi:predicted ester cyclase
MSEQNKHVVKRYFEELDHGKAHPVHMCTPDFVFHVAGFPSKGVDATKQFAAMFYTAMPDLTHPIEELIAEGDRVAFRGRYVGTHTGSSWACRRAVGASRPLASAFSESPMARSPSSGSLRIG